MFLGALQNLILSIFDRNDQLLRSMRRLFDIKSAEGYVFQTRSSAIAFCMLRSKSTDTRQLKYLLCDTATFGAWSDKVVEEVKAVFKAEDSVNNGIDKGLLDTLNIDLKDALTALLPNHQG
ncbi:hypothetical protein BGZ89_002915 [Linnemannia elongata]|nr:hypothetical protein BGZ89_002915 [Linnemannia elongata]